MTFLLHQLQHGVIQESIWLLSVHVSFKSILAVQFSTCTIRTTVTFDLDLFCWHDFTLHRIIIFTSSREENWALYMLGKTKTRVKLTVG